MIRPVSRLSKSPRTGWPRSILKKLSQEDLAEQVETALVNRRCGQDPVAFQSVGICALSAGCWVGLGWQGRGGGSSRAVGRIKLQACLGSELILT